MANGNLHMTFFCKVMLYLTSLAITLNANRQRQKKNLLTYPFIYTFNWNTNSSSLMKLGQVVKNAENDIGQKTATITSSCVAAPRQRCRMLQTGGVNFQ